VTGSRSRRVRVRSADQAIVRRVVGLKGDECTRRPPSAWAVIAELRCGSLRNFRWYLNAHKGIPDPAVAEELCKLLSGSKYRIMVEDTLPYKNKGGRPSTRYRPPTRIEREVAQAYSETIRSGQSDSTAIILSKKYDISVRTVYAYIKRVRDHEEVREKFQDIPLVEDFSLESFRKARDAWCKVNPYKDWHPSEENLGSQLAERVKPSSSKKPHLAPK